MKPRLTLAGLGGKSLAMAAALALLVLAADRSGLRWDCSPDARFSVHPVLAELLAGLTEPVEVVGVWSHDAGDPLTGYVSSQLDGLTAVAPLLSWRHLDPELDRPEVEALRQRLGRAAPGFLHIVRGGRNRLLPVTGDLRYTLQRRLGGTIAALGAGDEVPVYVPQGHGELALTPGGLAQLADRLSLGGMRVVPLSPSALTQTYGDRLPGDGVLLLAGPGADLGPALRGTIDRYWREGGPTLLLIDDRCPPDLRELLARWCLHPTPTVLHSLERSQPGDDRALHRLRLDPEFGIIPSPATAQARRDERGRPIISPRSVHLARVMVEEMPDAERHAFLADGHIPPIHDQVHLAVPGEAVWLAGADDRRVADAQGSAAAQGFPVAVLARTVTYRAPDAARDTRLTVWGSREAAADAWGSESAYANLMLLADLVADLAGREASLPIPEQEWRAFEIGTDEGGLNIVWALLVALMPSVCVGIAVLAWWERR